jgi:hypothetical protein
VNGLEPSASTLRIQTGLSSDPGLYEKSQLDRPFGEPLMTVLDHYRPPSRARIAHGAAIATALVRIKPWVILGNVGGERWRMGLAKVSPPWVPSETPGALASQRLPGSS